MVILFVFFFQAEDGIRDVAVTGVQTCALPIYDRRRRTEVLDPHRLPDLDKERQCGGDRRSEERRVGKECRSRWSPDPEKKNDERCAGASRGHGPEVLMPKPAPKPQQI